MKRFIPRLPVFLIGAAVLPQYESPPPAASPDTAAEAAAVTAAVAGIFGVYGACCLFQVLLFGCMLAGWVVLGIWIMNDAKSRQSENAQLVTVLGWVMPIVGLIIHLATRPNVNLVVCPNCKKKRIEGSAVCPHCGQP